jgi:hypothetical protein
MITVEITAAIDAAGTLTTLYFADGRLITEATDTPANTAFDETLLDPGSIATTAFGDGRTGGGTRLSIGEIKIANLDGAYDAWLGYGFDGRQAIIRQGTAGAAYPSGFTTLFTGTVEALTVNRGEVIVRLRDKQRVLDQPVLTSQYGGTNVLPAGIDGTANDLAGKPKPRLFGKVLNISPPSVNTSKLVYQISAGQIASVEAVYDRGAALTAGTDYANSGLLLAASPGAGTYDTCLAEGLIRLGASPAGAVTVDATQGGAATDRTAATMLSTLALAAGVLAGDISSADVTALAADAPAVLGVWISGAGETYAKVMDAIAASVGAYYAFDPTGVLRMGRLVAPAGTAVLELEEYDALNIERRPARDSDLPAWAYTVRHSRVWTVQGSDIATAVTAARRAVIGTEYREQRAENAAVRLQFLLAAEESVDTLLTSATDAANEASRRQALHGVHRDFFDVVVPAEMLTGAAPKLTAVVQLTNARFGLSAGRLFLLLGTRLELARNRATLTLWG